MMIKQILAIAILAMSFVSYSQDNLEFNQAIQGNLFGSSGGAPIGTLTVPAGKVWKIEARGVVNSSYSTVNVGTFCATIGEILAFSNEYPSQLPIWLPEGTYDVRINASNGGGYYFGYSGIEYNVEP